MPIKRPNLAGIGGNFFGGSDTPAPHPVDHMLGKYKHGQLLEVPIEALTPDPDQPRKVFEPEALQELANTIARDGVLQPLIIRPIPDSNDRFLILAGERRHRASMIAGLKTVPAVINLGGDKDEVALIENIQRRDLNPVEEAEALAKFKESHDLAAAQVAQRLGKGVRAIEESISIAHLPDDIRAEARTSAEVKKSQLLLVVRETNAERRRALWEQIKNGQGTVRELRAEKKKTSNPSKPGPKPYTFTHRPEDKTFTVSVKFRKSTVDLNEVRAALQEALNRLT